MLMDEGQQVILPGGLGDTEFPTTKSVLDDDEPEKKDAPTLREGE
jgi:hypothetical protein